MATVSNKIYVSVICFDGTDNGPCGVLSVTGNQLRQEGMNIISYRKSVASRVDGYLAHQVLQDTVVYN